jgi:phosphatidylinositol-3-phosphatase
VASVLTAHDRTWKAYMENLPRAGYIGDDRFPYLKRHNPFAYFSTVRTQPQQRKNIVPFESFSDDLKHNSLPDYSFIAPNIYHDGHDNPKTHRLAACGDHEALHEIDGWLKDKMDPLIRSDAFVRGGLLVIVFDEACEGGPHADWRYDGDHPTVKGGGRVPAIIISSQIPPGTTSDVVYHHQSVLRLSLRALGVETAPGLASMAPDMSEFFSKPAQAVSSGSKARDASSHPEATSR